MYVNYVLYNDAVYIHICINIYTYIQFNNVVRGGTVQCRVSYKLFNITRSVYTFNRQFENLQIFNIDSL